MDSQKSKQLDKLLRQSSNDNGGMRISFAVQYSNGRTGHLDELDPQETNLLIRFLMEQVKQIKRKMTGKIIYYSCLLGYTLENGDADFDRINKMVQNIGSNNPRRKTNIHFLNYDETHAVLTQITAMVKKRLK